MKTTATFALRFAALLALTFAVLASVNVDAARAPIKAGVSADGGASMAGRQVSDKNLP